MSETWNAHVTNKTSKANILAAKLLMKLEELAARQERMWVRGVTPDNDGLDVPMETWDRIGTAAKDAAKEEQSAGLHGVFDVLKTVNLAKQYRPATVTVRLTVQQWADLLEARDAALREPSVLVAYDSEHWNQHGAFPGR